MKILDLVTLLNLEVYGGKAGLENEINGGYTSDLLSDVMGNANSGDLWITLQTHKNVIAIASLKDLAAVLLINNNKPELDMLKQADEEGIPVLGTAMKSFEVSAKLYNLMNS
ncbi:MAG: serine kinase [Gelidibacter sp.]|nr:serine kinase [Gelidibacter sp.]